MHNHVRSKRKLGREKGPRELMFRNLATSIILHERVKTTLPKAKEVRPKLEKLITIAKKGDLSATRKLHAYLLDRKAAEKLLVEIAPLYEKRMGGYTRIIKLGSRPGDGAEMAVIELIDTDKLIKKMKEKKVNAAAEKKNDNKAASKKNSKNMKTSAREEAKGAGK
jgi:large subunit ribosomal protein L17